MTVDAASGHYAFTFPVRPGETRFQVAYTLPYTGKQAFALKLSVPTGDVAVMLPKSMQFQGPAAFQPLNDPSVVNSQSYDAHQPAGGAAGGVHRRRHRAVAGIAGHGARRDAGGGGPRRRRSG